MRKLALRELWQMAEQRYPGLQAQRHAVAGAKYQRDEQLYLRLPSLELTSFLTWAPDIKCRELAIGGATIPKEICLSTNVTGSFLDGDLRSYLPHGVILRVDARLTQPLYTFGKLDAARDLGTVGLKLAQAGAEISRADLGLNVLRAYYGLKTARAALDTVKEGQDQIVKWIKRIDKDLESGKGGYSEIDLMRLKVADSQVQLGVVDIERTIKSTLAALRYLVQDEHADIDDSDLALLDEPERELSYYLEAALKSRPELRQLMALGEGALAYKRLRIAELLPDLALIANVSYGLASSVDDPQAAFLNRLNYLGGAAGLGLRWQLDLGPRIARLRKAQADLLQYEARRKEALGGVAVEVERSFHDLTEARRRLSAAEQGERRARGWLQGVKQAIDVGTAESRDMIDALRAFFDQHLLVLRTINDVNVLVATINRQCGLDVVPER